MNEERECLYCGRLLLDTQSEFCSDDCADDWHDDDPWYDDEDEYDDFLYEGDDSELENL